MTIPQCSTTKIECQTNTEKQASVSIETIRTALNEALPEIEDTAPHMKPKAGADEFEGPCPFCGGTDRFVVFPGEKNRYLCRKCSPTDKDGKRHSGDKIAFHIKFKEFKTFMELAKNVVPHVFSSAGNIAPKKKPGRKKRKKPSIDFSSWWKGLPTNATQKTKIHEFLVDERDIDPKVVDKHIAKGNLKYAEINGELHVLAAYKSSDGLPAVQRLTMKNKAFIKNSEASSQCLFIAGSRADKVDSIMIHESVIDALSGECLYPDICHIAIGSTTLTRKVSVLKGLDKKILVAQDNDEAGEKMLKTIIDILGPDVMGIKWPEKAKEKMDVNDILRSGEKPKIGKVFAPSWAIFFDGLIGGFSLCNTKFPPMKWAVKGLIAEGVNLLAGKPKCGKSMFCLNLAISIATGQKAFGAIDVEQGCVIYLALEDVERRLKERMIKMNGKNSPDLDSIQLNIKWARMGEGGIKKLSIALERRPNTRLVIIDTLKMFRPAESKNKKPYDADYEPIARIKEEIADKFNVPVLIIHHLRKMDAEDIFDTMSGSTGLTGATDSNIIFQKEAASSSATLHVQGRDIESTKYAIKLDSDNMRWEFLGDAKDIKSTDNKQNVYNAIKEADKPLSPKELEKITGIDNGYIRKILPDLMNEGGVKKQGRGKYIYSGDPEEPLNDN